MCTENYSPQISYGTATFRSDGLIDILSKKIQHLPVRWINLVRRVEQKLENLFTAGHYFSRPGTGQNTISQFNKFKHAGKQDKLVMKHLTKLLHQAP